MEGAGRGWSNSKTQGIRLRAANCESELDRINARGPGPDTALVPVFLISTWIEMDRVLW